MFNLNSLSMKQATDNPTQKKIISHVYCLLFQDMFLSTEVSKCTSELALLWVQIISAPSLHRMHGYNNFNDAGIQLISP